MATPFVVTWNSKELTSAFGKLGRTQLPFAMSLAANWTAQDVRSNERKVMQSRLDRPTPFTLNSLYIKAATKKNPQAMVFFKDYIPRGAPAGKYLQPQVFGGQRRYKGLEVALERMGMLKPGQYLVPTKAAATDPYGNVPRGTISRIMSGLRLHWKAGYDSNATKSGRSLRKGNAQRYFFGTVGGDAGIWERRRFGFGVGVRPLFIVTDKAPVYRKRFPFFQVAQNTVKARYERHFRSAFAQALASAR